MEDSFFFLCACANFHGKQIATKFRHSDEKYLNGGKKLVKRKKGNEEMSYEQRVTCKPTSTSKLSYFSRLHPTHGLSTEIFLKEIHRQEKYDYFNNLMATNSISQSIISNLITVWFCSNRYRKMPFQFKHLKIADGK